MNAEYVLVITSDAKDRKMALSLPSMRLQTSGRERLANEH